MVVLIVIVLPIVLDKEPSPIGQDLVIQIPSQEAGRFNTRVLPAPGAAIKAGSGSEGLKSDRAAKSEILPTPPKAVTAGEPAAGSAVSPARTEPVPVEGKAPSAPERGATKDSRNANDPPRTAKDDPEAVRAKALLEGKEAWVVRLGAYSNEANVEQLRAKLTAAGVKSYTEAAKSAKGDQTRVRAGPFDSRAEAEQAQEKLKAAGVSPGTVGPR